MARLTGRQVALGSLIAAGVIYHPTTPTNPQRALERPDTPTIATTTSTLLLPGLLEENAKMIFGMQRCEFISNETR